MDFETLLLDVDDKGIAVVTINRPDKLNALNETVIDELEAVFKRIRAGGDIHAVILTGAGPKSFVAGADISRFTELDADLGRKFAERGQHVFELIEDLPKPVIAAVNGFALGGGCELALACHLRIAANTAVFGQPEVNLGILPGYGATQRLPRLVGRGLALEMILTAEHVPAQRAYEIGLANKVVPAGELLQTAKAMAASIVSKAPIAVRLSLEAVLSSDLPLREGLEREAELFGQACASEDFREGVDAFLNRRRPAFKGI